MARLPYADISSESTRDLAAQIVEERGRMLHLYQMLLHSPPLAEGWLAFFTAVRQRCSLPAAIRELVIMRVALINRADYEAEQHRPIALQAGLSPTQLEALAGWETSGSFDDMQRAVLALTDTMTTHVQVPKTLIEEVDACFEPAQVVELVATVAAYNMVSRFLEALDIHSNDEAHDTGAG